jgi:hypothetical protein
LFVKQVGGFGASDTDFSSHTGETDLNTSVAFNTESSGEELVELSLENSVGNEALLGVHLSDFLVCHL